MRGLGASHLTFSDSGMTMSAVFDRPLARFLAVLAALALMLSGAITTASAARAAGEASIAGTVTDDSGDPVEGVVVAAHSYNAVDDYWFQETSVMTAADGTYSLQNLPAGEYRIEFATYNVARSVIAEWWQDAETLDTAMPVVVGEGEVLTGIDPVLALGGAIAGTVTDQGGTPVENVWIQVYEQSADFGGRSWSAWTGPDGAYSVTGLPAGEYKIQFSTEAAGADVAGEWWDDADGQSAAAIIPLERGQVVNASAALASAGAISGRVTDERGEPAGGVSVVATAFDASSDYWDYRASTVTDENGDYQLRGLAAGEYHVEFSPGEDLLHEVWDDAPSHDEAQTIVVTAGATTAGIDAALASAGTVAGVVTDEHGTPVSGVGVMVEVHDVPGADKGSGQGTHTAEDGSYSIGQLRPGAYKVRFDTEASEPSVVAGWWNGADDEESAAIVTVAGRTTTTISPTLASGGVVLGTVTDERGEPAQDVSVQVSSVNPGGGSGFGYTAEDGSYRVAGLPAGDYVVKFGGTESVVGEWWDDARERSDARVVTVAKGAVISGISPQLAIAGAVSGVVRDTHGDPVSDVDVRVTRVGVSPMDFDGWHSARTEPDGSYRVGGLETGDYTVYFSTEDASTSVLDEWWDDADTKATATPVAVTEGQTTAGISPQLAVGGEISGSVVDGDGAPFEYFSVQAYRANEPLVAAETWTWRGTEFTVRGLRTGDYKVRFSAETTDGKTLVEWWDNTSSRDGALPIPVTAGERTDGIDIVLAEDDGSVVDTRSGSLAGTVVDGFGNPIENAEIAIMDARGRGGDGRATDASGRWWLDGLGSGDYRVGFRANVGGDVVTQFWEDSGDFDSAKVIALAPGEQRSGIDAVLRGAPLPEIESSVPSIAGIPLVGGVLMVQPGAWTDGTAFSYRWFANGRVIAGATASTLLLTADLVGAVIAVEVTGMKTGYQTAVRSSTATPPVAGLTFSAPTPTIKGSAVVGATLSAAAGSWKPAPTLAYQWLADGKAIAGATAAAFTITPAQLSKKLSVRVTGSAPGYTSLTKTSGSTGPVKPGTLRAAVPTIAGTIAVGATVTAKPGAWTTGTAFTYQWYSNGKAISKATKASYKIPGSLQGKKLSVKVTGKKSGFTTAAKTSKATAKILKTGSPKISGKAVIGSKLTAKPGKWTSGTKFSYQWLADGKAIAKATKSSFTVGGAQAGKKISVRVTGKKAGYASAAKVTGATARVLLSAKPTISGSRSVTAVLTANAGTWTAGTSLSYRWYANGKAIAGATKPTLSLGGALGGKKITVQVTGKKAGYATATRTSSATGKISYPSRYVPSGWNCPSWAPIKGNADSGIYHKPGQRFYNRTNPEECFRTESAAKNAGYRKSKV